MADGVRGNERHGARGSEGSRRPGVAEAAMDDIPRNASSKLARSLSRDGG